MHIRAGAGFVRYGVKTGASYFSRQASAHDCQTRPHTLSTFNQSPSALSELCTSLSQTRCISLSALCSSLSLHGCESVGIRYASATNGSPSTALTYQSDIRLRCSLAVASELCQAPVPVAGRRWSFRSLRAGGWRGCTGKSCAGAGANL